VNDLGSKAEADKVRQVSAIARSSLSSQKFSSLYHRMIARYDHPTVVELGTSFGINTLYLAAKEDSRVTTFEGSEEVAGIADLTFAFAGAKNIKIIRGNINSTLPTFLQTIRKFDFAFIDANHTYEATVKYFTLLLTRLHEKSVIVIDDIHYSAAMEKAWKEIKANKLVYGSLDLYRAGIVFFDPSLNKQHVILQF
jgi:predicted O-methyltransferase YrrM